MPSKIQLKSNNNLVYSCKYHVVWCPKYRRPLLINHIAERCKELIVEKANELKADILATQIMPDHVHILVEVDPQFGIHRFVKRIKGYTSRMLRQEFKVLRTRIPTLWTNSYCVLTVGGTPVSVLKQYIENQKSV
jgi:putative transposase